MQYVEAPAEVPMTGVRVFLAGGIGNCPDWQAEAVRMLKHTDLVLLNPRREEFNVPWTYEASQEQITWEYKALDEADIILFWFAGCGSVQPIALFELGVHTARRATPLVIGVDRDYPRANDVDIQLGLSRPDLHIYRSLAFVCAEVERLAREMS